MDTLSPTALREKRIFRMTQIVWYFLYVIETFLVLRFVLKLLQANPNAGFTKLIYQFSSIFTEPFQYVFPTPVVEGSVFEWTTLLALGVYWLLALGIIRLICMGRPVTHEEVKVKLDQEEVE